MATPANLNTIMTGAEVLVEPGQLPEEIDMLFSRLAQAGMQVTRIRMFENYMHRPNGPWDFSLFDTAFTAADKYGIKVWLNLFPATHFEDIGGFKYPQSETHLHEIAAYIKAVVQHFTSYECCYGWVPINEPGGMPLPQGAYTAGVRNAWLQGQASEAMPYQPMDTTAERFKMHYNTRFLHWLCQQIRKYDNVRPIHVNNHNIFVNAAEYDFISWRSFIDSFGASAHASWHFSYWQRQEYALAISANSEMIRSGAGDKPWFMTELQGGNNIYSGRQPMCPQPFEVAQWLWTVMATGGKGSIFWCLNPRMTGHEAGEWAMLNYLDEPSERMLTAAEVIKSLEPYRHIMESAVLHESGVNVIYTHESLWLENRLSMPGEADPSRRPGAVIQSTLAWFCAVSTMGLQCNFKEIREYDFSRNDYSGQVLIFSHQISIPQAFIPKLQHFIQHGGNLVYDGLSGYYNEHGRCMVKNNRAYQEIFGARLKEIEYVGDAGNANNTWQVPLTFMGSLKLNNDAKPYKNAVGAVKHHNKAMAVWLPFMLGLGAWQKRNFSALYEVLAQLPIKQQIRCRGCGKHSFIKVLTAPGGEIITIIINSGPAALLHLEGLPPHYTARVIYGSNETLQKHSVAIQADTAMAIMWKP